MAASENPADSDAVDRPDSADEVDSSSIGSDSRSGSDSPAESGTDRESSESEPRAPGPPSRADRRKRQQRTRQQQRRRRIRAWSLIGFGVVILALAGWTAIRALNAYQHLSEAKGLVAELRAEVAEHGIDRPDRLIDLAGKLQTEAADAVSATDDPIYRAAGIVPWLGDDLQAVSHIARAVDALAEPLPQAAQFVKGLNPDALVHDGTIDIDMLRGAASLVGALQAGVDQSMAQVAQIPRGGLLSSVASAAQELNDQLPALAHYTRTGTTVANLVLPMVGADGPRTYLLAFQNSAEPRATGGIFGSYLALHLDAGKITIDSQGASSRVLDSFDQPQGELDAETEKLYTARIATFPMNVNFTPDFPAAAQRFALMYRARTGQPVDGVVAIDPVVVSALLRGQQPIVLPDGASIDADSVVKFLLSDIYAKFPTGADVAARDAYTTAATSAVFASIMTNPIDPTVLLGALRAAADERRILVWSARAEEQQALVGSAVGGSLTVPDPPGQPTVGLYFNDGTGTKLGYYLHGSATLSSSGCTTDGKPRAQLTATVRSTAPTSGLPEYVLANRPDVPDSYQMQLNVLVVAPQGGAVTDVQVDGKSVPVLDGVDHGRPVAMATVYLPAGQSSTLTASVDFLAAGGAIAPKIVTTPGVHPWQVQVRPFAVCGP